MPRYSYICEKCERVFSIIHSMNETIQKCTHSECPDGGHLRKLPTLFCKTTKKEENVGEVVKKYIEDVRREVKEEKEILKKQEYKKEQETKS